MLLLAYGADLGATNANGLSALALAATMRDVDTVSLLLANGANVESRDALGNTVLLSAVAALAGGELISLLIAKGADVDAMNYEGISAVDYAFYTDQMESHQIMLKARKSSVEVSTEDDDGQGKTTSDKRNNNHEDNSHPTNNDNLFDFAF